MSISVQDLAEWYDSRGIGDVARTRPTLLSRMGIMEETDLVSNNIKKSWDKSINTAQEYQSIFDEYKDDPAEAVKHIEKEFREEIKRL